MNTFYHHITCFFCNYETNLNTKWGSDSTFTYKALFVDIASKTKRCITIFFSFQYHNTLGLDFKKQHPLNSDHSPSEICYVCPANWVMLSSHDRQLSWSQHWHCTRSGPCGCSDKCISLNHMLSKSLPPFYFSDAKWFSLKIQLCRAPIVCVCVLGQ